MRRSTLRARRFPPGRASRAAAGGVLHKAAEAIEARAEQVAQDMTAEMGKPLREARLEALRAATILRYAAGEAYRPIGEVYEPSVADQRLFTLRRPVGVVGLDHALELPGRDPGLEARPGADLRQHARPQARLRGAAHRAPHRGVLRRGGAAGRRAERAHGRRLQGGRGDRLEPRASTRSRSPGRYRSDARARRGDRARLPRPARARRPQPAHRDALPRSSTGRSRRRTPARSGRPGRSAPRRDASSSRTPPTTRSARSCSRASRRARSGSGRSRGEVGPVVNEGAMEEILGAIERARADGGTVLAGGERVDDDGYLIAPTVFEGSPTTRSSRARRSSDRSPRSTAFRARRSDRAANAVALRPRRRRSSPAICGRRSDSRARSRRGSST